MSERATAYSIQPQRNVPAAANDVAVRPKVLRRPAHFNASRAIEAPTPTLIPLHAAEPIAKPAPAFRAWQDDGKFAITLLALVIIVNLVVSAWLSAISPSAAPTKASAVQATPIDAAPAVHVLDNRARDISEQ